MATDAPANVDGGALAVEEVAEDDLLVGGELLGQRSKGGVLGRQRLRPVEGEVEGAAAVVEFLGLARRRLVRAEEAADGVVERLAEQLGLGIARAQRHVLKGNGQGQILAQRVPAQVVLVQELLNVLGRRAAGARLKQPAARQQRHNAQHLGRRAQLLAVVVWRGMEIEQGGGHPKAAHVLASLARPVRGWGRGR